MRSGAAGSTIGRRGPRQLDQAVLIDVRVDPGQEQREQSVRVAQVLLQVVGEVRSPLVESAQTARDGDALLAQQSEVDVRPSARSRQRDAGCAAGDAGVRQVVHRHGPDHGLEPVPDVSIPVAPRSPGVTPDREHHVPARAAELASDLLAARPGTDDEDAAGGQEVRPPVPRDGQLERCRRARSGRRPGCAGDRSRPWPRRRSLRSRWRRSVWTRKPPSPRRTTCSTAVCSMTGAANEQA